MQAIVVPTPGGPDQLTWQEVPDPTAGPGHVVVEVAATAVNRADLLQRQGHYDPPPGAPPYLGLECSGRVLEVGDGVERLGGGRRGLRAARGRWLRRARRRTSRAAHAAAGGRRPRRRGGVARGRVHRVVEPLHAGRAAARRDGPDPRRGVGHRDVRHPAGAQLGARVAVTAGSARTSSSAVAELGADVLVNYREQDFVEAVRAATEGHGADVVLDIIGAKYLTRNVEVLATNGRLAIIGMQGGTRAELDLAALMSRRAAMFSATLRARPSAEKAAIWRSVVENVWPEIEAGARTSGGGPGPPPDRCRRGASHRRGERPCRQGRPHRPPLRSQIA